MRMGDLQMLMNSGEYMDLVQGIKQEIQSAQYRAALNVNKELICLYYDIGSAINEHKTWGNKFIENLATDIKLAFPEAKGYSVRNLKYMAKFALRFPNFEIVQAALAQLTDAQREAIISEFWLGQKPDARARREAIRALRHPRIRKPLMEYYG